MTRRAARRQAFEMDPRRFVRAVLRPHHAENAELGQIRLAAEDLTLSLQILRREVVLFERLGGDGCFGTHQSTFRSKTKQKFYRV